MKFLTVILVMLNFTSDIQASDNWWSVDLKTAEGIIVTGEVLLPDSVAFKPILMENADGSPIPGYAMTQVSINISEIKWIKINKVLGGDGFLLPGSINVHSTIQLKNGKQATGIIMNHEPLCAAEAEVKDSGAIDYVGEGLRVRMKHELTGKFITTTKNVAGLARDYRHKCIRIQSPDYGDIVEFIFHEQR